LHTGLQPYRLKEEFVLSYNYEYSLMSEEDTASLIKFLESIFLDSYIFDIQNTEHELFLLNAEKERAHVKSAVRYHSRQRLLKLKKLKDLIFEIF